MGVLSKQKITYLLPLNSGRNCKINRKKKLKVSKLTAAWNLLFWRELAIYSNAGLYKDSSPEVVNVACFLVNRPQSTVLECKTSEEVRPGTLADYFILKVIFFCPAYYLRNDGKLKPQAQ